MLRNLSARVAAAIAVLLGGFVIAVTITVVDDGGNAGPRTITVHVDGADRDRARDDTIKVAAPAVEKAKDQLEYGPGKSDPRPEAPVLRDDQVAPWLQALDRHRHNPLPTAGASQGFPGCVTRFVVNQSGRHGVRPSQFWVHYTASANRPGWGDVNAIVALFNRPSFSASSHFVIDGEGHCAYIVPIEAKAWTQAAANPFGINVEMINSGSEGRLAAPAGMAKLRQVALEVRRRVGIPVGRVGAVRSCTPARSGTVTHWMGGPCSGGHVDIRPYSIAAVASYFGKGGGIGNPSHLSKAERKVIRAVGHPKGTGHSRRYWCGRLHRHNAKLFRDGKRRGWKQSHRGTRFQAGHKAAKRHC